MDSDREKKLGDLLDLTCDVLIEKLRSGEANAADLNVARQLLKDNGIDCRISDPQAPVVRLAQALPFEVEADDLREAE